MAGVIIFDPADDNVGFSIGDTQANSVFLDREGGVMYVADLDTIYQWRGSTTDMTYTWRSGFIRMPTKVNLGAMILEADTYNDVIFRLFAMVSGQLTQVTSFTVTDNEVKRLPGGYLSSLYQIELSGTDRVTKISLAESVYELSAG